MDESLDDPKTELTERLVYLSAERTLSAWIRMSLSLMALGFVIDRFGLILHSLPVSPGSAEVYPRVMSTWAARSSSAWGS